MHNPFASFDEIYEITQTLIVNHEERVFKIEILQSMKTLDRNEFSSRVYVETDIKVNPTYSDDHLSKRVRAWSRLVDFPWVKHDNPDGAVSQTLGFLSERYKQK